MPGGQCGWSPVDGVTRATAGAGGGRRQCPSWAMGACGLRAGHRAGQGSAGSGLGVGAEERWADWIYAEDEECWLTGSVPSRPEVPRDPQL